MGLFNNGKNEKAQKVEKYEEKQDATSSKPNHRSSKHHSNKFSGAIIRQMPQPSLIPNQFNHLTPTFGYPQSIFTNSPQFKYNFPPSTPYDLSKYISTPTPFNPYMSAQAPLTNFAPMWSNGMSPFNDRSPFQQPPLNMYQQTGWPSYPPSTNGYMPPMNF
jgi:hypothetical protein